MNTQGIRINRNCVACWSRNRTLLNQLKSLFFNSLDGGV